MARERIARRASTKNYGEGQFEANPFFAGEETEFKGKPYTIMSPHGSEFGVGYLLIRDSSEMADAIEAEANHGGIKGSGKKGRK